VRIRTVKPEFFADEDVAELTPFARLLFIGLWNMSDREGRLEDRPRRIKKEILGYDDDVNIELLLTELADRTFLIRYEVDSRRYIQIRTFVRHQRPHPKEAPSVIPPAPAHLLPWKETAGNGQAGELHGEPPASRVDKGMDKGKEILDARGRADERDWVGEFEIWMRAYPREEREVPASRTYFEMRKLLPALPDLLAAIRVQLAAEPDPKFWRMPDRYLRELGWRDKPAPPRSDDRRAMGGRPSDQERRVRRKFNPHAGKGAP
jgi:hypothetical protein